MIASARRSGPPCGSGAGTSLEPYGVDDRVDVVVGEVGQPELVGRRPGTASAARRRSGASRSSVDGAEAAVDAPVALHDEVVVEVLGVEVATGRTCCRSAGSSRSRCRT